MADVSPVRRIVGPKSCDEGATAAQEKMAAAHTLPVARIAGMDGMA